MIMRLSVFALLISFVPNAVAMKLYTSEELDNLFGDDSLEAADDMDSDDEHIIESMDLLNKTLTEAPKDALYATDPLPKLQINGPSALAQQKDGSMIGGAKVDIGVDVNGKTHKESHKVTRDSNSKVLAEVRANERMPMFMPGFNPKARGETLRQKDQFIHNLLEEAKKRSKKPTDRELRPEEVENMERLQALAAKAEIIQQHMKKKASGLQSSLLETETASGNSLENSLESSVEKSLNMDDDELEDLGASSALMSPEIDASVLTGQASMKKRVGHNADEASELFEDPSAKVPSSALQTDSDKVTPQQFITESLDALQDKAVAAKESLEALVAAKEEAKHNKKKARAGHTLDLIPELAKNAKRGGSPISDGWQALGQKADPRYWEEKQAVQDSHKEARKAAVEVASGGEMMAESLLKSFATEDLRDMVDGLTAELSARYPGEDKDAIFAKLMAKRYTETQKRSGRRARNEDTTPMAVGVVIGILILVVIILVATSRKREDDSYSYKDELNFEDSDIESSETGTTDRELQARIQRFENRLEEHTRKLEEEDREKAQVTGVGASPKASTPNWMNKA